MAKIKRTELAEIVARLSEQTKDQKKLAKAIAGYLVQTHQTRELDAILRNVMTMREHNGVIEANVTSAFPLSSSVQKDIKDILKKEYPAAKRIVLDQKVDPEVLAGVKVQTVDKQLDETARGKLKQLTRAMA